MSRPVLLLIAAAAGFLLAFGGNLLLVYLWGVAVPGWVPVLAASVVTAIVAARSTRPQASPPAAQVPPPRSESLDPGTGALNESGLVAVILALMSIANRYQRPLSVASLRPGDPATVSQVVDSSLQSLRTTDRIGHYGEGLLLVVMPETDIDQARMVIQRLHDELQERAPLSAFGVAGFDSGDDLQALLARAEENVSAVTEQ
ncbi:MAG: hypothetical protein LJE84_02805 [Gammaproteobacteria bacterium]|jgi:hypothetical protein|nr:hypothetical protein [Gammaproteobacteria bacterium]